MNEDIKFLLNAFVIDVEMTTNVLKDLLMGLITLFIPAFPEESH